MMQAFSRVANEIHIEYSRELMFYRKYHTHILNNAIHIICIPLEWASFLLIISPTHLQYLVSIILLPYHILAKPYFSIIIGIFHLILAFMCGIINSKIGPIASFQIALVVQVVSWLLQVVIGHILVERNAPSMTQNISFYSIIFSVLMALDPF